MKEVKLQEICRIEKGKQIDTSQLRTDSPYKYINGGIKESGYYHEYNTDSEAVLVSEGGASCGYVNYVNEKFWCGCHCYKLTESKTLAKYLYYALKGNQYKIMELRSGAAMPNIKKEVFKNMSLLVDFDKNNQQAIVETLDCIQKTINNKTDELSSFDELVKSRFIEMFGEPKTNPQEFPVIPLSNVFDIGSSKRVYESEWTSCGVPFYRAREIVSLSKNGFVDNALFITEEMYRQYKNKYGVPKENDMMVTGVGTLGVCYIVKPNDKFYFKDGNTLWFKNKGLCNVIFIKELFDTDFVKEQIVANANASTVGTYTITKANNTMIIYPPIELQNEFAEFVKLIDKSKFVCHSKNFLCDIFTFSSSTIAYPSVVSIFVCPKRC